MNIWLDDIRQAPDGWIHLHNIEEVEKVISIMLAKDDLIIEKMSFDFHLNHPKLGVDVMKYLIEICQKKNSKRFWPKEILLHSNDPNGIRIMQEYLKEAENILSQI